mmetsp:Transcript_23588/g.52297  ORF Transcript_23588/g.52297 Transcript_23588/m.52297 type:complete len:80 (+) Transcript_23588:328-567(+)
MFLLFWKKIEEQISRRGYHQKIRTKHHWCTSTILELELWLRCSICYATTTHPSSSMSSMPPSQRIQINFSRTVLSAIFI